VEKSEGGLTERKPASQNREKKPCACLSAKAPSGNRPRRLAAGDLWQGEYVGDRLVYLGVRNQILGQESFTKTLSEGLGGKEKEGWVIGRGVGRWGMGSWRGRDIRKKKIGSRKKKLKTKKQKEKRKHHATQ